MIDPEILKVPGVRNLLGCQFGGVVSVPGVDDKSCERPADAVVVIYDGQNKVALKLCNGHKAFVLSQTYEHQE